jgi:transglutaminase-like putative cysteine protease
MRFLILAFCAFSLSAGSTFPRPNHAGKAQPSATGQQGVQVAQDLPNFRRLAYGIPDSLDLSQRTYRIEARPAQRIKAVLTTDIEEPSAGVRFWDLMAPAAPTIPGQRDVKTTFTPAGRPGNELSPLKRPLLVSRVPARGNAIHTELSIEATLYSRHLVPRSARDSATVADLTPEATRQFTRTSETMDFESKAFRDWMVRNELRRASEESDLAFAWRGFQLLKLGFQYDSRPGIVRASQVCQAGRSDCGGLSCLYVACLRANGIPARLLQGRWARSLASGDQLGNRPYGQWHVKAEFFAHGVGWVPVDLSVAINSPGRAESAFFGHDPGDFVVMHVDQDLIVNSPMGGRFSRFGMQTIWHWFRGAGSADGERVQENWVVHKINPAGR